MSDVQRYMEALRNADAAGDTQAASALSARIRQMQQQPTAQAPQAPQEQSYAGGLGQQALQGATLGFSDEIQSTIAGMVAKLGLAGDPPSPVAGAGQPSFSELRTEAQTGIRDDMEQFRTENPMASLAANVAGGLATGGVAAKGLQAARVPVTGLKGAVGGGAAVGGVAGAGVADEDKLEAAGTGALFGALTGGAVSRAGLGAKQLFRKFAPGVQNRIAALARNSQYTPAQMQTRLQALGPKATIADVDDIFRTGADVASARLGPTSRSLRDLARRDETTFGRLMQPIMRTLGDNDSAVRTLGQLKQVREQAASPMYEAAFARPLQMTNRLRDLLSRPETQKAWKAAQSIGKSDPDVDVALLARGADPSFRGMQAVTERLWDRADSLQRAGQKKFAHTIKQLRKAILDEMDAQSPEFQQARALWAGTKQADDMVEMGNQFLKMNADEIRDAMRTMSDSDKAFYRLGVGQAIERKMAQTSDTVDTSRMFRNEAFRRKAMEAFPSRESAVDFINTVRAESIKKGTTNAVGRGSQTAIRQAAERQLTGGAIGAEGVPTRQNILGRILSGVTGPREKTIQELGELLLSQDPATQQRAIALMTQGVQPQRMIFGGGSATASNLGGQYSTR